MSWVSHEDRVVTSHPVFDGVPEEHEAIVELWLQTKGYITSTSKWFGGHRASSGNRKGSLDIDVLAVSGEKTLIVSVTTNEDDKVARPASSSPTLKPSTTRMFEQSERFLRGVKEYAWMVRSRPVEWWLIHFWPHKKRRSKIVLSNRKEILVWAWEDIRHDFYEYFAKHRKGRIGNPTAKAVKLFVGKPSSGQGEE